MKDRNIHEVPIEHIDRLFREGLYGPESLVEDEAGRLRHDVWELADDVQADVKARWPEVTTENVLELAELEGFRSDFLRIFGFGIDGVDYEADVSPLV